MTFGPLDLIVFVAFVAIVGGLKAAVWADLIQGSALIFAVDPARARLADREREAHPRVVWRARPYDGRREMRVVGRVGVVLSLKADGIEGRVGCTAFPADVRQIARRVAVQDWCCGGDGQHSAACRIH